MIEALTLVLAFCAADIKQQYKLLHKEGSYQSELNQATRRLVSYGELSYWVLRDRTWGVGERTCNLEVWPAVLAPRTKRLIGDLGSNKFSVREQATEELMEIGRYNRIILIQESGKGSDLERLNRLQQILDSLPSSR
jgi:hypothetical protein